MIVLHPYDPPDDWRVVDARLGLPSDDGVRRLAALVNAKMGAAAHEDRNANYRENALFGERHFARVFRVKMKPRDTPWWDKSRDNFTLADGTRVDLITRTPNKSFPIPQILLRCDSTPTADVVCACAFWGAAYEPELVGWAYDQEIRDLGQVHEYHNPTQWQADNPSWIWPLDRYRPMCTLMQRHNPDDPLAVCPPEPVMTPRPETGPPTAPDLFGGMSEVKPPKKRRTR